MLNLSSFSRFSKIWVCTEDLYHGIFLNPGCNCTVTFVLKEKLLKLEDNVLPSFIYILISFVNYAYQIKWM